MTIQDKFKRAVAIGVAKSPFATTSAAPLIIIKASVRTPLSGCVVEVADNKAQADEWGIDRVLTVSAQIPKTILADKPRVDLDAVEYQGRQYSLSSAEGDEAHSAVWVIEGTSPFKAA